MLSLFLRNLIFTILHPGLVAGLIPYWILENKLNSRLAEPLRFYQLVAVLIFIIGLVILLSCITNFAVKGRGTLSPFDPTRRLVTTGLYRFSRNPMYVGVTLMLTGEAVFFKSSQLWIYLLLVFATFNLFILLNEEPRLKKDFGEDYHAYCRKVRRWI